MSLACASAFAQGGPQDAANNKPSVSVGPGQPKERKDKPTTVRHVKGVVLDETGKPVDRALVYLTDLSSKEKWTFVTKPDGKYNFDSLSLTVDYDLSAKKGAIASPVKHLSQYDRTTPMVRNLELALSGPPVAAASTGQDSPPSGSPAKQ